jgi:hypothetical protein
MAGNQLDRQRDAIELTANVCDYAFFLTSKIGIRTAGSRALHKELHCRKGKQIGIAGLAQRKLKRREPIEVLAGNLQWLATCCDDVHERRVAEEAFGQSCDSLYHMKEQEAFVAWQGTPAGLQVSPASERDARRHSRQRK